MHITLYVLPHIHIFWKSFVTWVSFWNKFYIFLKQTSLFPHFTTKSSDGCRAKKSRNRDRSPAQGFIFLQGWINGRISSCPSFGFACETNYNATRSPHRLAFYSNASVRGHSRLYTVNYGRSQQSNKIAFHACGTHAGKPRVQVAPNPDLTAR